MGRSSSSALGHRDRHRQLRIASTDVCPPKTAEHKLEKPPLPDSDVCVLTPKQVPC
jgi:hypothetical protein